ncbi:MAG TPA: M20/M25/M40 family metallo-hydrolase [Candidatus Brocadiia bacterium]|nr:M20/M25/M40 family metallo-hydrolase [Candidatus Brocadiia bacterium]
MPSRARQDIHDFVTSHRGPILSLLEEMVGCNSFSHNKAGVDAVAAMIGRHVPPRFSHQVFRQNELGDHHVYSWLPPGAAKSIVLAGHLDTLCPPDPSFNSLVDRGETLHGPGVNDMKSGDVVLIWAVKALDALGLLDRLPLTIIFNGDEEIGSPTSNAIFSGMAGKASAALVFECGGPEGTVVTTRKGVTRQRLHITGAPSHFGNLKGAKVSAVLEAAHKIIAIEALNRPDKSVVANAGRVEGGLAANAVAEKAVIDFEARYWTPEIEAETRKAIASLVSAPAVPGCSLRVEQLSFRPPMRPTPQSMRLFHTIVALAASMGETIIEEKRGGVSDACWLSHAGIPTVDGLGPLGDHDFTPKEYITKETLFRRIELTANLLIEMRQAGFLA